MSETASKARPTGAPGAAHEGALQANGRRFAICAARFNDGCVGRLLAGARQALREAGAADGDVELFRCPGAMELAGLARRVVESGRFDGVVCLGAVIRGRHAALRPGGRRSGARHRGAGGRGARSRVASACSPATRMEQALERRAKRKEDNRGYDAAMVVGRDGRPATRR